MRKTYLTLTLLTWRIEWALNNGSRWQMEFNLAFKGLKTSSTDTCVHKWYNCAEYGASKLLIIIHCTASTANSHRSCTVKN